jgi:hypothetical protein
MAKLMVDLATKQVEDRELTPEERGVDPDGDRSLGSL